MTISVAVNGAYGKMGRLACESLLQDSRFKLIGQLGREDNLASFLQQKKPQVLVDLTRADVVYENACVIIDHGVHPVIGASGLTDGQIEYLTKQCAAMKLGGLIVPNFSLGVLLMIHFAKQAAQFLDAVEIIEMHHAQKFDAPSGTALKTAKEIASTRKAYHVDEKQIGMQARGQWANDIPIHSLRLPGILAKQSVIFGEIGETLTITHESIDRQSFMPGLLLACEKVMTLNELKYGLEQVVEGL
jgi:4-hydroxy-tetrahydrodipicolinate reductase